MAILATGLSVFTKTGRKSRQRTKITRSALTSSPTFLWLVVIVFAMFLANTGALTIFETGVRAQAAQRGGVLDRLRDRAGARVGHPDHHGFGAPAEVRSLGADLGLDVRGGGGAPRHLGRGTVRGGVVVGQALDGIVGGVLSAVPARLLAERHRSEFNVLAGALGAVGALGSLLSVS